MRGLLTGLSLFGLLLVAEARAGDGEGPWNRRGPRFAPGGRDGSFEPGPGFGAGERGRGLGRGAREGCPFEGTGRDGNRLGDPSPFRFFRRTGREGDGTEGRGRPQGRRVRRDSRPDTEKTCPRCGGSLTDGPMAGKASCGDGPRKGEAGFHRPFRRGRGGPFGERGAEGRRGTGPRGNGEGFFGRGFGRGEGCRPEGSHPGTGRGRGMGRGPSCGECESDFLRPGPGRRGGAKGRAENRRSGRRSGRS